MNDEYKFNVELDSLAQAAQLAAEEVLNVDHDFLWGAATKTYVKIATTGTFKELVDYELEFYGCCLGACNNL